MPQVLLVITFLSWLGSPPPAFQDPDPALRLLENAQTLRCLFPTGQLTTVTDVPPGHQDSEGEEAVFDSIDRQAGTARLIGTVGASDVRLVVGSVTLTFIEVTPLGQPHVTVVFARFRPGTRELLAADAEYSFVRAIDPAPFVGQYFGTCRAL